MRTLALLAFAALLVPISAAQDTDATDSAANEAYTILEVRARAGNQRVDLSWIPPLQTNDTGPVRAYNVYVYYAGTLHLNRTFENQTQTTFFLTNGRTYVFEVAAIKPDGQEGPRTNPIAATPRLPNDLAYLAAGLIAVWLGLFGYAAFLARKEASIDQKLDRMLKARFEGRSP